jgi:hypothetical protein
MMIMIGPLPDPFPSLLCNELTNASRSGGPDWPLPLGLTDWITGESPLGWRGADDQAHRIHHNSRISSLSERPRRPIAGYLTELGSCCIFGSTALEAIAATLSGAGLLITAPKLRDAYEQPQAGFADSGKPIHAACGRQGDRLVIVTVYMPTPPKFITPFERGNQP